MRNLLDELFEESYRINIHSKAHLRDFLYSAMDEARMISQSRFSRSELHNTGTDDWEYFRESIVKREINNIISYEKQRDHASHTVYNFLIGKYIYYNSQLVQNVLTEHSIVRGISDRAVFESAWPFVSLLHDIGYMFEGFISKNEVVNQTDLIKLGSDILNAYFDSIFWIECGVNSVADINFLETFSKIDHPHIDSNSIYSIINSLRDLNNIENIIKKTNELLDDKEIDLISDEISCDTFDLWIQNLEYFSRVWQKMDKSKIVILDHDTDYFEKMIERVRELRRYFTDVLIKGNKKISVRNIDHGVASGLILLKSSTLFFQIFHSIQLEYPDIANYPHKSIENFMKTLMEDSDRHFYNNNLLWWWQGIIWATMATAYHNFPVMKEFWPEDYNYDRLNIKEDPLTYLGLLVDILQEWDRYSSSFNSLSKDELPLQGKDMLLGIEECEDSNLIIISYPDTYDEKEYDKIVKKLNDLLENWQQIIRVQRHHIKTVEEIDKEEMNNKITNLLKLRNE